MLMILPRLYFFFTYLGSVVTEIHGESLISLGPDTQTDEKRDASFVLTIKQSVPLPKIFAFIESVS